MLFQPLRWVIIVLFSLTLIAISASFILATVPQFQGKAHIIIEKISEFIQDNFGPRGSLKGKPLEEIQYNEATGPLRVDPVNPRYFTDGSGKAILLSGSHTWLNLQDGVLTDPPPAFDYTGWLDFLQSQNHNFFRLWAWEQAKWVAESSTPYYFTPNIYLRTGPGNALDGKPKFDLTQFNQDYFDRMRQRIIEAGDRGIYVSIMLFNGWSVDTKADWGGGQSYPFDGHPFNASNNINGINGDTDGDRNGDETEDLSIPDVTALQEAYIRKVIDTVNDLDNVLYEICNEGGTVNWQYQLTDYIHTYEAGKPKQHPVGISQITGDDAELFASPADWVSIHDSGSLDSPYVADGSKVVVVDTDHICGICGDRYWVWKSFTRGKNPLFMDQYDDSYKLYGGGYDMNNPNDVSLRQNLSYILTYANRMNLEAMTPHGELASSGYALANPVASGAEYLVYLPSGGTSTVDLSAASGILTVEWFNPSDGTTTDGGTTPGGAIYSFTPPFGGDAVLYIYQASPSATPTSSSTPTPTNGPTPTETQTPNRKTIYLPIIKNKEDKSWLMRELIKITTPFVWWMNNRMSK